MKRDAPLEVHQRGLRMSVTEENIRVVRHLIKSEIVSGVGMIYCSGHAIFIDNLGFRKISASSSVICCQIERNGFLRRIISYHETIPYIINK